MGPRCLWLLLLLLVAAPWRGVQAAAPGPAPVAGPVPGEMTVAVLGIDAAGVPAAAAQALTAALRQHVATVANVRLLPASSDLVEVKLMFGCLDGRPECLAKAGKSLGAERLIYGSLHKSRGSYSVVIKQLDVTSGQVERFISDSASPRLWGHDSDLQARTQSWVKVLLAAAVHGGLRVLSTPPGAEVQVDGQPVGRAPLTLPRVLAGPHTVQVQLPGYAAAQRSLTLRGGATFEVDVTLQPLPSAVGAAASPPPAAAQSGQARTGKALKIVSYVLVGAAALSGGIALYTWRSYNQDADNARSALDILQSGFPNAPADVNDFFASQDRLSSCEVPATLAAQAMQQRVSSAAYSNYMDACRHGRSFAGATTGLLATMGSLALLGVTTYLIGDHLTRKAAPDGGKPAQAWRPSYRPRLTELSPVVNAQGGGVNLSIRF